jgi:hypothetical protein
MARIHFWHYIVDDQGRPLENVNVRFYLSDDPPQEADIFPHPSLGAPTTTTEADIKTDGNGFFEFWVGDEFEPLGGYISTQKFKLTWERAGILSGVINNIDIFPPVFKVDETDNTSSTKDEKNKLISNELGYKWDTHVDYDAPTNQPHSLQAVDTLSQDTTFNKLVSNSLINYILSAIASAGTLSIAATAAIERNFTVSSWTASGDDYYTDLIHSIGRAYPIVQVRETSNDEMVYPQRVISLDANTIRLWMADNNSAEVTIVG